MGTRAHHGNSRPERLSLEVLSNGYLAACPADGTLRLKLSNLEMPYGSCSACLPHLVPSSANRRKSLLGGDLAHTYDTRTYCRHAHTLSTSVRRRTHPKTGWILFKRHAAESGLRTAGQDILIGIQVAADLDNGAALDGVVAAAKRAWGFNFVAPSIHHFPQHFSKRPRRAQLESAVPIPSEPESSPSVVAPLPRCPDCLNPDAVMNQRTNTANMANVAPQEDP